MVRIRRGALVAVVALLSASSVVDVQAQSLESEVNAALGVDSQSPPAPQPAAEPAPAPSAAATEAPPAAPQPVWTEPVLAPVQLTTAAGVYCVPTTGICVDNLDELVEMIIAYLAPRPCRPGETGVEPVCLMTEIGRCPPGSLGLPPLCLVADVPGCPNGEIGTAPYCFSADIACPADAACEDPNATLCLVVSVPCPRSDADGDGVADEFDYCPEEEGTWDYDGCPQATDEQDEQDLDTGYSCPDGDSASCVEAGTPEEEAPYDDATLEEDPSGGGGNDLLGVLADPDSAYKRFRITTQSGWVTLRGTARGFAVALARNEWGFDWLEGQSSRGYRYGHVAGSADKCLWIEAQMLGPAKGAPRHDCAGQARRLRPSDFMSKWTGNYNRGPNQNCVWRTRDGGERRVRFCDGRTAQLNASACSAGAKAYANVKPWDPGQPAEDHLWTIPTKTASGNPINVKWRYITKDGRFIMIRDPHGRYGSTNRPFFQDWVFIPRGCISTSQLGHMRDPDY